MAALGPREGPPLTTASEIHPVLAVAFAALDDAGVRWCLLRGDQNLPNPPGDVDLLVTSSDRGALHTALAAAGFERERSWAGGSQMTYSNGSAGRSLLLHVVTRLDFRRTRLRLGRVVAAQVLARKTRSGPLWLPSETDAFWVTLAHLLLDKGRLTEKHRTRLADMVERAGDDTPLALELASAAPRGWDTSRILRTAREGRWTELEGIAPELQRAWSRRHPVGTLARGVADELSLIARKLRGS